MKHFTVVVNFFLGKNIIIKLFFAALLFLMRCRNIKNQIIKQLSIIVEMMVITLRRKTFIIGIISVRKRIIVHRNHNRIVIFDYFIKIIKFVENTGIVFL